MLLFVGEPVFIDVQPPAFSFFSSDLNPPFLIRCCIGQVAFVLCPIWGVVYAVAAFPNQEFIVVNETKDTGSFTFFRIMIRDVTGAERWSEIVISTIISAFRFGSKGDGLRYNQHGFEDTLA